MGPLRVTCSLSAWVLFCVTLGPGVRQTAAQPPALELKLHASGQRAGHARCGKFEVWENRATGSERKIALRVVELVALDTPVVTQPIVAFGRGPGEAVATDPQGYANVLSAARRHHIDACAARHGNNALPLSTTAATIDDVAEVVRALGYPTVNVAGSPYGSRAAGIHREAPVDGTHGNHRISGTGADQPHVGVRRGYRTRTPTA